MVNILGFAGHEVSITTAQLCQRHESSRRQDVNKRARLCANVTIYNKGGELDLICDHSPQTLV